MWHPCPTQIESGATMFIEIAQVQGNEKLNSELK